MAIGDYETVREAATGDDLSAGQVLSALVLLRRLRDELAGWEPQLIAAARDLGTSWAELAPALGVASRQAAERRYLRLRPWNWALPPRVGSVPNGTSARPTGRCRNGRATTPRRCAAWPVRWAGDVVVREALAEDDAVALLGPLMAALGRVRATSPELAQEIQAVSDRAEEVRRDTQTLRDNPTPRDDRTAPGGVLQDGTTLRDGLA